MDLISTLNRVSQRCKPQSTSTALASSSAIKLPVQSPQDDLAAAAKLIKKCGYHRRDQELAAAKLAILIRYPAEWRACPSLPPRRFGLALDGSMATLFQSITL